jgi:hypothetical protein
VGGLRRFRPGVEGGRQSSLNEIKAESFVIRFGL